MDNPLPSYSTSQPAPLKPKQTSWVALTGIILIILLILALFLLVLPQSQKVNQKVGPTPAPIGLKIPGLDPIAEGFVSEINVNYLVLSDSKKTVSESQTKIFIEAQTPVQVQTISSPSPKSTSSGITVNIISSQEKTTIDKINVGDEARIVLDERNNQLWTKSINILRKDTKP